MRGFDLLLGNLRGKTVGLRLFDFGALDLGLQDQVFFFRDERRLLEFCGLVLGDSLLLELALLDDSDRPMLIEEKLRFGIFTVDRRSLRGQALFLLQSGDPLLDLGCAYLIGSDRALLRALRARVARAVRRQPCPASTAAEIASFSFAGCRLSLANFSICLSGLFVALPSPVIWRMAPVSQSVLSSAESSLAFSAEIDDPLDDLAQHFAERQSADNRERRLQNGS